MNPYLVTATDRAGKRDSFVRDAESAPHLLSMLEREGYSDIETLDDDFSARLRGLTAANLRDDSAAGSRREAASRRQGPSTGRLWAAAARNHALLILVDLGLVAWGVAKERPLSIAVGAGLLLWWAWTVHRGLGKVDAYNDLVRADACGDEAECLRLIELLEADPRTAANPLLPGDLAFRRARIKARHGKLDEALADVQALRTRPDMANGAFESRIASTQYAAGDMDAYLRSMEAAYEASGRSNTLCLDLAFGHARVGDAARARELLDGFDAAVAPPYFRPLATAAEGALLERAGDATAAVDKLRDAVRGLEAFAGNVAVLPFVGILAARHAAALARAGRHDEARAALRPWREIALNCTDPETRRILETEVSG